MKEKIDLLLIHVPRFSGYYRPYGEYMSVNLLPMGSWLLADLAVRTGFKTRIIHLGLEWIETRKFSALPYIQDKDIVLAVIPLHWHQQSYDVMEAAGEIKKARPEIFIALGGYTASYFHKEIMAGYTQIDAVIRGDAEVPLPALLNAMKGGKGLETVPNLTWRQDGKVRENPLSYVASEKDIDNASYTNLGLLKDHRTYMHYMGMPFVWSKGFTKEQNRKYFHLGHDMFFVNVGRGCLGNCTWCGGGAKAQQKVNGRRGVIFRSPDKVADTVSEAAETGYDMIHLSFDPGKEAEKYYLDLFGLIRRRKINVLCYFESFSLPSEPFLNAFSETFKPAGSVIAISPESGDEQIRRLNRSFFFTNNELMENISLAQGLGIRVDLFFSIGIPGESCSDLSRTASFRKQIKKKFKNIGRIWTSPITMEPASPWFEEPASFGVVSMRRSFSDYYRAGSPDGKGLGYYIPDFNGNGPPMDAERFEKLLFETKCRDHCSFHANPNKASSPLEGRIYCHYLNWMTGRRNE
ncbi:putative Radical SAM domain protein [uncultured Desulfobacterium sp.]|uniref:Putative Radical SAM domain protein n=1 Tax=uncultured Desulfobacterium sp. TaxID=201089 RepID=A0A445MUQ7_9BACT|nr:putative Radical SAM domain protein [uncultured Desulfobacterium sp.]